jgi:hypothetical protein
VQLDLEPGQEVQVTTEITKQFLLTQPGTYRVRVVRYNVWTEKDEDNKRFFEVVYSNSVQFTVTP